MGERNASRQEGWRGGTRSEPAVRRGLGPVAASITVVAIALCGALLPAGAASDAASTSPVTGPSTTTPAAPAALTVTPSTGLVDDETVSVVVTGASPGSTYVAVECDPTAFTLLAEGESPADACETRHNAVMSVDAGGVAAVTFQPQAVITTALGAGDCRAVQCLVAVESLYSTGGPALLVEDISYAPTACDGAHACTTPADAWDPSLNVATGTRASTGAATGQPQATEATTAPGLPTATPGRPAQVPVTAGTAGDLTAPGAVTGPYGGPFPAPVVPDPPVSGEGLLRLALSAPNTSFAAARPSSTVVDVTLTDVTTSTTVSEQQLVLFDGATTFVYGGFTGPVTTADSYRVTVAAEPSEANGGLSWPAHSSVPRAVVADSQLEVVDPTNPQYLAYAYAPVMYGRSTSALHDVPLLTDATATPEAGGATHLSYTVIWSHEDAGTGFVPFLEWGTWGRMTDIENAISFTVAADGSVSGASYLWGGEPPTGFPDSHGAIQEVDVPFAGQWDGHHPILRDATGNNDFSDAGTTPFRFQMAPVPGPAPGQTRESVMDANPFTYQISGEEVTRWYGDVSTDPRSPEPGDARQYATIDLNASGTGVTSLAVELQLSGDRTWYASDLHSGYPANGAGHFRTVVKLPTGWQGRPVTGVRVQVYPASAAGSVTVNGIEVLALQPDWSLTVESIPRPHVVPGVAAIATAMGLSATSGDDQQVRAGRPVAQLRATVVDSLGTPLAGVPVTFTTRARGFTFDGCGCTTITALTDGDGVATSGRARAPDQVGQATIRASTPDPKTPPVKFILDTAGG